jgi:hypothetical protein
MPAECICNLQLQPDDLGSTPSLGRNACRECTVFAISNCNRAFFVPIPSWAGEPAECISNLHLQLSYLGSNPPLGREACRVYL